MERNARIRTLIQLGSLLVKSGLTEKMGIPLGVDLQNHPTHQQKADQLLEMMKSWARMIENQTGSLK